MDLSAEQRKEVLGTLVPKTLISEMRSEAIIVGGAADFAHTVYRSVPGGTVMRLSTAGDTAAAYELYGDVTVIALAPSTAGGGDYAEREFGRRYELPPDVAPFWSKPISDVIRIERFFKTDSGLFSNYLEDDWPFTFEARRRE